MNSPNPSPDPQGLAARRIAAEILEGVLRRGRSLDDQLDGGGAHAGLASLPERDRALARRLIATVLRRLGTLRHLLGLYLERGIPKDSPRVETALLIGAAQILWLDVPDHAAVDLSVRLVQADRRDAGYAGLVNAVLRAYRAKRGAAIARHRHRRARHAGLADGALAARLRRRDWRTPSPPPTARSRRSTSR